MEKVSYKLWDGRNPMEGSVSAGAVVESIRETAAESRKWNVAVLLSAAGGVDLLLCLLRALPPAVGEEDATAIRPLASFWISRVSDGAAAAMAILSVVLTI